MRNFRTLVYVVFGFSVLVSNAQNPGDTVWVNTLNYNSTVRDTVVQFPTANTSYERIYMLYSMRCKDGLISDGNNKNRGCGEWDYSCNTYLHDSTYADSVKATHPNYTVSNFSSSKFNYSINPTYNFYQHVQKGVIINSTIADTVTTLGTSTLGLGHVLNTAQHGGKSQYLFTQSELITAGLSSGDIDGLSLEVSSVPEKAKFLRVRIKQTTDTVLSTPHLTGFTEVYYYNQPFVLGSNRLQFYTPFNWDGISNLIVETSFSNKAPAAGMQIYGDASGAGLVSSGDSYLDFDGSNYIEVPGYKGVSGSAKRTVEAWIKTDAATSYEIVSWGTNSAGQKWLVRLDGSGKLRTEVNSGNRVGTTNMSDNQWHHIAVVVRGSSTSDIDLYVDGVKETISSTANRNINSASNLNVRIGKGFHGKDFVGVISNVRVWSDELSEATLKDWMYKEIDNSHPDYASLELDMPINEGMGSIITDLSANGRTGSLKNAQTWNEIKGLEHFKNFTPRNERPMLTFHQGVYNLTISNDTVVDSVQQTSHLVREYAVFSKAGTVQSDSLGIVATDTYWESGFENTYDPTGALISSVPAAHDGTINISNLDYFKRNPSKFEIMSFVTPYGLGLDLGMDGHTWLFDVTDFAPILKGKKRLTMERGGQWQEDMDIKFMYIVGTPPRDVLDIQQLWKVDKVTYANIDADRYFEPRDVMMDANGHYFKIRSAITGHGQQGEFIPRNHQVNLNGGGPEFNWKVWKECSFNPIHPQGGTWIYDRAGWCPGMATDIQHFDITNMVTAGQSTNIDYTMDAATGNSSYIVSHQLVTYGEANHTLDAAVVEILSPTNRVEYWKHGSMCKGAEVRIQNTGSTDLTSLEIKYWVNGASTPETYTWNGNLKFMETEVVLLPVGGSLWNTINGSNDFFYVEVANPNGGADEYAHNNMRYTDFSIPEVLPNSIYFQFRTNLAGNESSFELHDEWGNVVASRDNMANSTTYRDTVNLGNGCYTLIIDDTGHDGIDFWANNDGIGQFWIRDAGTNILLKNLEGDFGGQMIYRFTVNYPLTYEELNPIKEIAVYPNPASNKLTVVVPELSNTTIHVINTLGQEVTIPFSDNGNRRMFDVSTLNSGVYFINFYDGSTTVTKKVVVQ